MSEEISGPVLLTIARDAIAARLGGPPCRIPSFAWLEVPRAVFVTIRKGTRLHGCIGTTEPSRTLGEAVARNARLAAFEDPRTRPLEPEELAEVRIEVSILGAPEPIAFSDEASARAALRPHVDGVVLSHGHRRGLFLPQVWSTLPEPKAFLDALKEKAGLPADLWDDAIELSRFEVVAFHEPGYRE